MHCDTIVVTVELVTRETQRRQNCGMKMLLKSRTVVYLKEGKGILLQGLQFLSHSVAGKGILLQGLQFLPHSVAVWKQQI